MTEWLLKQDSEWRQILTPEQFHVAREGGTERPFTGEYWHHHSDGLYRCVCCGQILFSSVAKFDSGCGWPSYTEAVSDDSIETEIDVSHGMFRTEVHCSRCGAHLGHLFDDGPSPTGLRYCVNSASLTFEGR